MDSFTITRAALGSAANLGDLYDARRDTFCGISAFKRNIPGYACSLIDSNFSDITLVQSDSFSEKCNKLNVTAELKVSVLSGLFNLEGSGRYLSDQKQSARTVKSSLIYNIKTKKESLNPYHEELKSSYALDALETGMATHMVVGILWGANSILSCIYENSDNRNTKEIGGMLSAQLRKATFSISGKAAVDFKEGENDRGIKFDIRIYGDILPKNEELPTTFEGALELMKKLPKLVDTANEGKGKPLMYTLVPLTLLQKYLSFEMKADSVLRRLDELSLTRVVRFSDSLSSCKEKFNDFYHDVVDFPFCLTTNAYQVIAKLQNELNEYETLFRSELREMLTRIRSGNTNENLLEKFLPKYENHKMSPAKLQQVLNIEYRNIKRKIKLAKQLSEFGAMYIGHDRHFEDELSSNFRCKSFVLYFEGGATTENLTRWAENQELFISNMKHDKDNNKHYVVDGELQSGFEKFNKLGSIIQVYQSGKLVIQDLLLEKKNAACKLSKPRLVLAKNMNVLILGEPGIGKSTFINGIANYLTHESLEAAEVNKLITLESANFVVCDDKMKPVSVNTGNVGKKPENIQIHLHSYGNVTIRLIRIPMVSKPQNKTELELIYEAMKKFDKIHAICILLHPNSTDLPVGTKKVLQHAFSLLNDASLKTNVKFCFTRSRETFFQPGKSFVDLQEFINQSCKRKVVLNKDSVYCFDGESIRFLSCLENNAPISVTSNDKQLFEYSWNNSRLELFRMLDHVQKLTPLNTQSLAPLNISKITRDYPDQNRVVVGVGPDGFFKYSN